MKAILVLVLIAVALAEELDYDYQTSDVTESIEGFEESVTNSELPSSDEGADSTADYPDDVVQPGENDDSSEEAPENSSFLPSLKYEKEFYTFTVNDDDFSEPLSEDKIAGNLYQNLRVIFIKGPEDNSLDDAALALAKHASEQNTAIYILSKQNDIGDLSNKLNALRDDKNHKPEVLFVKYRTPDDAANAQKSIQKQYDSLDGSSKSHDGGVVPTINFASKTPIEAPNSVSEVPEALDTPATRKPESTYLPSSFFTL